MEHQTFSVIMVNSNQARFLREALDSVLRQKTNFRFNIIIVDNNSTEDNSVEIIKEYAEKYPEIIVPIFSKENNGYLANTIKALDVLNAEYVCFLDADDYFIDNEKFQKSYDFLRNNPEYTIYSTNIMKVYEDGTKIPYLNTNVMEADFSFEDFFEGNIIYSPTPATVFRNVVYKNGVPKLMRESVGTLSERSFEGDMAKFFIHLFRGKSHFVNHTDGVYRIHSGGIWTHLNQFDKDILVSKMFMDFNVFFGDKYKYTFLGESYFYFRKAINSLSDDDNMFCVGKSDKEAMLMCLISEELSKHKQMVFNYFDERYQQQIKMKLRDRIRLKIYADLNKKLKRKGLV
jgi:glycosyltransferase involved in cell wall biosynthesis